MSKLSSFLLVVLVLSFLFAIVRANEVEEKALKEEKEREEENERKVLEVAEAARKAEEERAERELNHKERIAEIRARTQMDRNIERGDTEEFRAKMEEITRRSDQKAKEFQKEIKERKHAREERRKRARKPRDEL